MVWVWPKVGQPVIILMVILQYHPDKIEASILSITGQPTTSTSTHLTAYSGIADPTILHLLGSHALYKMHAMGFIIPAIFHKLPEGRRENTDEGHSSSFSALSICTFTSFFHENRMAIRPLIYLLHSLSPPLPLFLYHSLTLIEGGPLECESLSANTDELFSSTTITS